MTKNIANLTYFFSIASIVNSDRYSKKWKKICAYSLLNVDFDVVSRIQKATESALF